MNNSEIIVDSPRPVGTITINRAERMNALNFNHRTIYRNLTNNN
jgi:enoyl-CoA hydratase/carnithine racemase